jgi:CheY-like chemotaxis protein
MSLLEQVANDEDTERDAALLVLYLRRGGYQPAIVRVETAAEMQAQLDGSEFDVVISDFNLPRFGALAALDVLKSSGRQLPFIVLSGEASEEVIARVMQAGATHYVPKDQMIRIVPLVERELEPRS